MGLLTDIAAWKYLTSNSGHGHRVDKAATALRDFQMDYSNVPNRGLYGFENTRLYHIGSYVVDAIQYIVLDCIWTWVVLLLIVTVLKATCEAMQWQRLHVDYWRDGTPRSKWDRREAVRKKLEKCARIL